MALKRPCTFHAWSHAPSGSQLSHRMSTFTNGLYSQHGNAVAVLTLHTKLSLLLYVQSNCNVKFKGRRLLRSFHMDLLSLLYPIILTSPTSRMNSPYANAFGTVHRTPILVSNWISTSMCAANCSDCWRWLQLHRHKPSQ